MSKRTSSGTSKAKAFTKDGPKGRPPNRPRYQPITKALNRFVSRPTCCLFSIPKGVGAGRGGTSSASGNDEGNKDVVRWRGIHRGLCGSSGAIGEGDRIANDYAEDVEGGIDELYMESSQCRHGSNIMDTPPTESSHRICIYLYQNRCPYRGTCLPTNNFYLQ
nr:hypothetical protein [Tanacetum cinerariifolium]